MLFRAVFLLLALFWLTMNVLLWRAEYGSRPSAGSAVPAAVVWQKVLTAPDSSSLTILHHRKKIGFCHWMTGISEELSRLGAEAGAPEELKERVPGGRIQVEGNLALPELGNRLRFEGCLKLTTNHSWQEVNARLTLRPAVWEIRSVAAEQTVRLRAEDGDSRFERVLTFAELEHPEALLRQVADPFMAGLLGGLSRPGGSQKISSLALGLKWEARLDSMRIGHSPVRAYRLQARWLDRYQAVVFVSRVGEVLRVELPDEVVLVNDQLAGF